MAKTPTKSWKTKRTAAELFMRKLGQGDSYSLKDVAAAMYSAGKVKQADLLEVLKSGDLVAAVFWPTASESRSIPSAYWNQIPPDSFNVRERAPTGSWREQTYELHRGELNRVLILPLLKRIRDRLSPQSGDGPPTAHLTAVGAEQPEEVATMLDTAMAALKSRPRAEVRITQESARRFANGYYGSWAGKRGRPPFEQTHAMLEAFARLYGNPLPKQTALAEDLAKWNMNHFGWGTDGWMRKEILTPIWKALKLPEDE